MEMVAAARLRRAEQRIEALRPYAGAIRRMTRQAAEAAGNVPNLPILRSTRREDASALLLVTGDRGLAGAFNSQIIRAGCAPRAELRGRGQGGRLLRVRAPRRLVADVPRPRARAGAYTGFTDRPAFAERARDRRRPDRPPTSTARSTASRSSTTATSRRSRRRCAARRCCRCSRRRSSRRGRRAEEDERRDEQGHHRALVEYEPDPEEILAAARARLRRDLDLPGAARVDRVRARRAHDRDAQRVRQRRRADRRPHARDEPRRARRRSRRRSWKSSPAPRRSV